MSKKIIAVSLALFMIVTCFVACEKKKEYETTKINGQEVVLVTDENGRPVINDKNQVIALVTNEHGEVLHYANGEDQTRYIDLIEALEINGVVHGENYKFNVLEGWAPGEGTRINKKGTDDKCYIHFVKNKQLESNETLTSFLLSIDEQNNQASEILKTKDFVLTIEKGAEMVSGNKINCESRIYKIVDKDNKIIHYAENYYFVADNVVYSVNYVCIDGSGYDESFSFGNYLKANFTFVN